jgi:protein-disulfide isomerase/uncharacterized membrane protein
MTTKTKLFFLLLVLGLLTLLDHGYLTYEYYNLHSGMAEGSSICNISSKFNCDAVAASSYSSLAGIPVALYGFLAQAALLTVLLIGQSGLTENPAQVRRYFFWGTALVALVSVAMGSISTFRLGTYCLFCIGAYLLSFASLLAAWFYQDQSPLSTFGEDLSQSFSERRWLWAVVVAVPVGAFVGNGMLGSSYDLNKMTPLIQSSIEKWKSSTPQEFDLGKGLTFQNGTQAPLMTIVEFADFRCPHCRLAYPGLEAFAQSHPDVKLVFKSFPLDGTCNKAMTRSGDGLTCKLAFTVFCAEKVMHKGWETHHWIYDHQEQFQSASDFPEKLHQISQELHLDEGKISECINSDVMTQEVQSMAAEGANAKIDGTPALFVNSRMYVYGQFLPFLESLYKELKSQH